MSPSPRYIDDVDYRGGFSASDIDELLASLADNHLGWSAMMAPVIMANPDRPELGEELTNSFCRTDPAIARDFARVTFTSDNRADLARVKADLDENGPATIDRDGVLTALRAYFTAHGFDANWDAIEEMPDGALVNTLAMVCPFEPPEKQALLEAQTAPERAGTLLTLLQMGAHTSDLGQSGRRAT